MLLCAPGATEFLSHRETTNTGKVSNGHRFSLFVVKHLVTINPSAAEILTDMCTMTRFGASSNFDYL